MPLQFGAIFSLCADDFQMNIDSMPNDIQYFILQSFFGEDGLQYSLGRVPLGGCDFSPHVYTYDDHDNDFELQFFNLSSIDYDFRVCFRF